MSRKKLYSHDTITVGKPITKQSGALTPADHYRAFINGQPLPEQRPLAYGDASSIDYARARDALAEFNSEFQELPAQARDHFSNDPEQYLNFLESNASAIDQDGLGTVLRQELTPAEPAPETARANDFAQNEGTDSESAPEETSTPT